MTYLTEIQDIRDDNKDQHDKIVMFEQDRTPTEIAILIAKRNHDLDMSLSHENYLEDIKKQNKAHTRKRMNNFQDIQEDAQLVLGEYEIKGINFSPIQRQKGNNTVTLNEKKWMGNFLFAGNK